MRLRYEPNSNRNVLLQRQFNEKEKLVHQMPFFQTKQKGDKNSSDSIDAETEIENITRRRVALLTNDKNKSPRDYQQNHRFFRAPRIAFEYFFGALGGFSGAIDDEFAIKQESANQF